MKYGLPGISNIVSSTSTTKIESQILFPGRVADIILDKRLVPDLAIPVEKKYGIDME